MHCGTVASPVVGRGWWEGAGLQEAYHGSLPGQWDDVRLASAMGQG